MLWTWPSAAAPKPERNAAWLTEAASRALGRGNYEEGLSLLLEAYQKFPSAKLRYNLGIAYSMLGRDLEAAEHFEGFLDQATDLPVDARRYARNKLLEYDLRRGRNDLAVAQLKALLPDAQSPEEKAKWERLLAELSAKLPPAPVEEPPTVARPEVVAPPPPPPPRSWARRNAAGITLLSLSIASLATSLATGLSAHSIDNDLSGKCDTQRNCPPVVADDVTRAQRLAVASDVMLGVGAVAVVTATVLMLVERRAHRRAVATEAKASAGPWSAGASLAWAF
jgi:tetratricopeptide (TPR) repeat protein